MAKGDVAVSNPKDIKVVVMDGGGNDVLIDQQSCLTDKTHGGADGRHGVHERRDEHGRAA